MFQKCPMCSGSGWRYDCVEDKHNKPCSVCNGKKIIDDKTGQPPSSTEEALGEINKWIDVMNIFQETFSNVMDEETKKDIIEKKSKFQERLAKLAEEKGYKLPVK